MKNKNGFTLIELLAVIVVLGIIMTIATVNVIGTIKDSKEKAKFIAAKDIVEIAKAVMATDNAACTDGCLDSEGKIRTSVCVNVKYLVDNDYLESDATKPRTGENSGVGDQPIQAVCYSNSTKEQTDYKTNYNDSQNFDYYEFDSYTYSMFRQ